MFASLHPIDQAVALALTVERGKVAGSPALGLDRAALRFAHGARAAAIARDAVRRALAALLADRRIDILSVDVDVTTPGQLRMAVTYRNNATGSAGSVTI